MRRRTGDATGQWSQHQDTGDSQVVQALAAACANERAAPDRHRTSAGSISDTVGTLLGRPSTRDPAAVVSNNGSSSAAAAGTSAQSSTEPEPEPDFAKAAQPRNAMAWVVGWTCMYELLVLCLMIALLP